MTEILSASSPGALQRAADLLRDGELVAFPTETVYGLGANALNAEAAAKIFAAKGRPATDPLIVHLGDRGQLSQICTRFPPLAERLTEAFWPGPLTLVLPRAEAVPPNVSAGLPTVAVRIPSHPVALALLRETGLPIAAPSANRFAHTSPTTAQHVYADLADRLPLILDGGPTQIGVESTILDLSDTIPRILRPGGISLEQIREFAPETEVVQRFAEPGEEAMPAPGMLLKHYSPRARLVLLSGSDAAVQQAILEQARSLQHDDLKPGLLIAESDQEAMSELDGVPCVVLGTAEDLDGVARSLFAALRTLDEQGVDVILARTFPQHGIGAAIYDRLLRAAEGRVIRV